MQTQDTIVALASATGMGRVGIIRVSGPDATRVVEQLVPAAFAPIHNATRASRREGRVTLNSKHSLPVTAYVWPTERSYTGQPSVELHVPACAPLIENVLSELYRLGARPAERGEFTLRAFLAGHLDLAQADAVLGVIDAFDHTELQVALRQLAGGLSGKISGLRAELLDVLADLEAGLDFVEEDIEFINQAQLVARLSRVRDSVHELQQQADGRMRSAERKRVVLAGLPNAGKSTLFNALGGKSVAIVSEQAGTTRDYLSAVVEWHGREFELIDTAGWDESASAIEHEAQAQRDQQIQEADLVLWCSACDFSAEQRVRERQWSSEIEASGRPLLIVSTKTDLAFEETPLGLPQGLGGFCASPSGGDRPSSAEAVEPLGQAQGRRFVGRVSGQSGAGLANLRQQVTNWFAAENSSGELLGATAARGKESLRGAFDSLVAAIVAAEQCWGGELIAIDLRQALDQLGQIVGAVYTDDILDRIFSRFCIGK